MFRFVFLSLLAALATAAGQLSTVPPITCPTHPALPPTGGVIIKPAPVNLPTSPPATRRESAAVHSSLEGKPLGDDALRLQIFLDEAKFGPGIVDGKPGRFTELAVNCWNEANGYPVDDWVAVNTAARRAIPNPTATALVPDLVNDWVDPDLPTKPILQAKKKRMSYRSVGEFMAERYHCDEPYLATLNGVTKISTLKARDSILVPNITPFYIEKLTGARYEADPVLSQRHVVVDTKMNQARIFEAAPAALVVAEPGSAAATSLNRPNHGLIASFPITPGQPKFIKFGTWDLRGMVELPYWRYDQQLLDTGKRSSDAESLNIPAGPNSPVGVIWNGLSKPGIGMHGTPSPETIGRARSHGCIRLANWDAIRLPSLIRPGATVEIR